MEELEPQESVPSTSATSSRFAASLETDMGGLDITASKAVSLDTVPFDLLVLIISALEHYDDIRNLLQVSRRMHQRIAPFYNQSILSMDLECYPDQRGFLHNCTLFHDVIVAIREKERKDIDDKVYPPFQLSKLRELRITLKPRWNRRPGRTERIQRRARVWEKDDDMARVERQFLAAELKKASPRVRLILPTRTSRGRANQTEFLYDNKEVGYSGMRCVSPSDKTLEQQSIWTKLVLQVKVLVGHFDRYPDAVLRSRDRKFNLKWPFRTSSLNVLVERTWCGHQMRALLPPPRHWQQFKAILGLFSIQKEHEANRWRSRKSGMGRALVDPGMRDPCPRYFQEYYFTINPISTSAESNEIRSIALRSLTTLRLCRRPRWTNYDDIEILFTKDSTPLPLQDRNSVPQQLTHFAAIPSTVWTNLWSRTLLFTRIQTELLTSLCLENLDIAPGTSTWDMTAMSGRCWALNFRIRFHGHQLAVALLYLFESLQILRIRNVRLLGGDPGSPLLHLGSGDSCTHRIHGRDSEDFQSTIDWNLIEGPPQDRDRWKEQLLTSEVLERPNWIRDIFQPLLFGIWATSTFVLWTQDTLRLFDESEEPSKQVAMRYTSVPSVEFQDLFDGYHSEKDEGLGRSLVEACAAEIMACHERDAVLDEIDTQARLAGIRHALRKTVTSRPLHLPKPDYERTSEEAERERAIDLYLARIREMNQTRSSGSEEEPTPWSVFPFRLGKSGRFR
ncbi:hypothetical protein BJ508DRAFT_416648 [Ascobolus immersus RN42]|uniref:F-box domain-containing protein n=1 Tax=Ascobolus immersus RN42 TaxID=1160509 RepID=A0A3N4HX00_ASCIM|nr:hypothetical protein BJ508DRAFT_416648 [Ascobolus immersus RN42]